MSLVGKNAPGFTADAVVGKEFKTVSLSQHKGRWVVLFFYPLDFTFVCPTEITSFSDAFEKFHAEGAEILGVSVDSKHSHLAWINTPRKQGGVGSLNFPLVSDIKKTMSRDYGVLIEEAGIALRGLFIIDPEGKVAYEVVHDLGIGRNVEETLRVLQAIKTVRETGEVCPTGWQKGAGTMKADPEGSKKWFTANA